MDKDVFKIGYELRLRIKGLQKTLDKAKDSLTVASDKKQLMVVIGMDKDGRVEYIEDTELANEIAHVKIKYCEAKITQLEEEFNKL